MPRLIHATETRGCGATIRLDGGETCMVSVAQAGVLVRRFPEGAIKQLFGALIGAELFNERNVYLAAATSAVLSERFPVQAAELEFKNPVLRAFSNAIWHCGTAAEVAVALNSALADARKLT